MGNRSNPSTRRHLSTMYRVLASLPAPTFPPRGRPKKAEGRTSIQAVLGGAGSKCDRFHTPARHPCASRVADYPNSRRTVLGPGPSEPKTTERLHRSATTATGIHCAHEHMFASGYDRFGPSGHPDETTRGTRLPLPPHHSISRAIRTTQRPVGMFITRLPHPLPASPETRYLPA